MIVNPILAADIGLSCQLHKLLYFDCMLSTNQSFHSKANVFNNLHVLRNNRTKEGSNNSPVMFPTLGLKHWSE